MTVRTNKKYQWIMRVLKTKYLEDIIKGKIRFSTPKEWDNAGGGKNDQFEGAIAVMKPRITKAMIRSGCDIEEKTFSGRRVLFDRKIKNVPCICFYGLEEKQGETIIDPRYFDDFTDKDRSEYSCLIIDAGDLSKRLRKAIKPFGFDVSEDNCDLFFHSILYIDIDDVSKQIEKDKIEFPYELLIKDKKYSHQKELRILVTVENEKFLKKIMKDNNGILKFDASNLNYYLREIPKHDEIMKFIQYNNGTADIVYEEKSENILQPN